MRNSLLLVCWICFNQLISGSQIFTATASYRLLPHIIVKKPIPPEYADLFRSCFCPGVVQVDPVTKVVSIDKDNLRKDSVSREVLRHPEFADSVELSRVRDFFLCTYMCIPFPVSALIHWHDSQRRI